MLEYLVILSIQTVVVDAKKMQDYMDKGGK